MQYLNTASHTALRLTKISLRHRLQGRRFSLRRGLRQKNTTLGRRKAEFNQALTRNLAAETAKAVTLN